MLTGDLAAPGSAPYAWSFLIAIVLLGFGWGLAIAGTFIAAVRAWRKQAHENAYMNERATWRLSPGPSRVVRGRVETDGPDVAVELDIVQVVEDRTAKNSRWHVWKETSRSLKARPFKLAHEGGQTVLVEPGKDVFIVDSLATDYPRDKPRARVRAATVRKDEEVFVYGDLFEGPSGGAYRGGAAFVLRPPRAGRILVATEAMRDRYVACARYLRTAGLTLMILYGLFHVAFTLPFAAAILFGKHETATVTDVHSYVSHGKSGPVTHYVMKVTARDGFMLEEEIPRDVYLRAQRSATFGETVTVPLVRTDDSTWASYLGDEPHVHGIALFLGLLVAVIATTIAWSMVRSKLAWYDRKTVIEHGGAGYWIESRTHDGKGPPIDPMRSA